MRLQRVLPLLLSALLLAVIPWPSLAEDKATSLVVIGEALILQGDRPAARQRALEEAFSAALTQVLGAFISAESYTRNFESIERGVLGKTQGYIKHYEILVETVDTDLLRLEARVTVSSEGIQDDLAALGILLDAIGNPVLAVEGAEEGNNTPSAVNHLKQSLVQQGLQLAEDSGSPADVVIRVQGNIKNRATLPAVGMSGAVVSLQAKAIRSRTGQLLAETSAEANATALTETAALAEAYTKAADHLAPGLLDALVKQWQNQVNNGRLIRLRLEVGSFNMLQGFKRRLGRIFGVKAVDLKEYRDGKAILVARFRGSSDLLGELIGRTEWGSISAQIMTLDAEGISLALTERR